MIISKKIFSVGGYIFISLCAGLTFVFLPMRAAFSAEQTNISVFVREGCVHCQNEEQFLTGLKQEAGMNLSLNYYDIGEAQNRALFEQVTDYYKITKGTPVTLVRNHLISGFDTAQTTGVLLRAIIAEETKPNSKFEDIINGGAEIASPEAHTICSDGETQECKPDTRPFLVSIPFTSKTLDVRSFSLNTLSLVLGLIDGFNPCAMWVLVMFLIILSQLNSRKRMLQYAGIFIAAEAIMYYAILNVWLTTWNFIQLNSIVIPIVGALALGSGIYFIYKYATYSEVCEVASPEQRQKITERVKDLARRNMTLGVLLGIFGLAFSVNIFEFACSIGIPQTFTKIMEVNTVSWVGQQWYMFLYIIMYMFDDMVVFALALYSIDKIHLTHKYSKWSSLIGGILMLILGAILLFKPALLMF